jgi:hypothetical protein
VEQEDQRQQFIVLLQAFMVKELRAELILLVVYILLVVAVVLAVLAEMGLVVLFQEMVELVDYHILLVQQFITPVVVVVD